jgi:septal ring factor EnvC (AmiA/AmiB activator)
MDAQQITLILVALVTSTGTYLATKSTNKVSLQNENVKNAKALYDQYVAINKELQDKVDKLEKKVEQLQEKYEKEIAFYKDEIDRLEDVIDVLEGENESLKNENKILKGGI